MRPVDRLAFAWNALAAAPTRSGLVVLACAVGVAAVLALTALGEGARQYVLGEFRGLGSELLVVLPGRNESGGGPPGLMYETERDLTIEDAEALARLPGVTAMAPLAVGSATLHANGRVREAMVLGTSHALPETRSIKPGRGTFLPPLPLDQQQAVCVLGHTLARELFGTALVQDSVQGSILGSWVRIGGWRFRVIGVLADQGTALGDNLNEVAFIHVAAAQALFDQPGLFRILVRARSSAEIDPLKRRLTETLAARHQGDQDFSVFSQEALLATFDRVFGTLTLAVAGIAAISLLVAGVIVMNVMLVAVSQRRAEVGLLKACWRW